ncbi:MAG: NAD-glutamate dehydrogenase, partial [Bdellovibrionales bacterium]|nr:NAD-glutamate dehydrogenase [Bdellovibrionales bacterium]
FFFFLKPAKKPAKKGQPRNANKNEIFLSASLLAQYLFAKAPVEFLEAKSSENLIEICRSVKSEFDAFIQADTPLTVRIDWKGDFAAAYIILGDRPFIVNSTRECIVARGVSLNVYLHPIIIRDGQRISCAYVELKDINREECDLLKVQLEQTLEHLILVTDDFTPMLVQVETVARLLESKSSDSLYPVKERRETLQFLRWLSDGGFIFSGLSVWKPLSESEFSEGSHQFSERDVILGIHKLSSTYGRQLAEELQEDLTLASRSDQLFSMSKLRTESLIQKRLRLVNITIRERSTDGKCVTFYQISGLLTSKALSEESSSVPILRQKLKDLLDIEGAIEQSHDYKSMINIFNAMPKEEALQLDTPDLQSLVHTALYIQNNNESAVSIREVQSGRSVLALVVIPRDRFNSETRKKLQSHIEKLFNASSESSEYYLDMSNKGFARLYFSVLVSDSFSVNLNLQSLKDDIRVLIRDWREQLRDRIFSSELFDSPHEMWNVYGHAFGEDYVKLQRTDEAEQD